MKKVSILVVITLFLFALNSCSDDSGTDPGNEFAGAKFELTNGTKWYYDLYVLSLDEELQPQQSIYLYEDEVTLDNKKCLAVYIGPEEESLKNLISSYAYADNEGYYSYHEEFFQEYLGFFPELDEKWIKQIDFKNSNWKLFDFTIDSTMPNGKQFEAKFYYGGNIVNTIKVDYKGEEMNATVYRTDLDAFISKDGEIEKQDKRSLEFTVIDGIGIYGFDYYENGDKKIIYQVLTDHK